MKEEKKETGDLKAEVRVSVRKGTLAPEYLSILKEAGEASGNGTIVVTSTARTPYDQARVMSRISSGRVSLIRGVNTASRGGR